MILKFLKKNPLEKETRKKEIWCKLGNAIMYLSDVFVVLMIITWILYILISLPAAWIELFKYGTTTIFNDLKDACTLPLSVGGAIWMIRICITHHSAQKNGKKLTPDFPNLDADGNVISNVELNVKGINNNEPDEEYIPNEEGEGDIL